MEMEIDTSDIDSYLMSHLSMHVTDSSQYAGRIELDCVGSELGFTVLILVEEGSRETGTQPGTLESPGCCLLMSNKSTA